MAWFKVDDAFHSSKPVMRIPRRYRAAAVGLWTLAGTWSSQEEMDGFVPEYVLEEVCGTPALAATLVRAGLWNQVTQESQEGSGVSGESGWQFRKWSDYNPLRVDLEEKREAERLRKANYRKSQGSPKGVPAGHPVGHQPESSPPDPTRPDPLKSVGSRKPERPMPEAWEPNDTHKSYASTNGINIAFQAERFTNWAKAKDARYRDWDAAFRNWLLKAEKSPAPGTSPWDRKGVHT